MPIRFRCAYCNQLMGISRRKAGTVVRCPNCSGQVVVPTGEDGEGAPEQEPAPAPAPAAKGPTAPSPGSTVPLPAPNVGKLFERGDFEKHFSTGPTAPPAPPANDEDDADADAFLVPPPLLPPPPQGVVLSKSMATLLSVAIVVVIALAFVAGLLIGKFALSR